MDFVVSKVALSICALLVASVLGNVYGQGAFRDPSGELEGIAMDLVATASGPLDARTECRISWDVPRLSAGEGVSLEVSVSHVRASAASASATIVAPFPLHTWSWDGRPLNGSLVDDMDESAPWTVATSGGTIVMTVSQVPLGTGLELLVFVLPGD